MRALIVILGTWFAFFSQADPAMVRSQDAEAWVSLRVAPALVQQLAAHPRFRGESVRVVVFEDNLPAASSNTFALSLRERLAVALFETPGIRMAAPQDSASRLDCTLDDVDYYVGLQVTSLGNEEVRIDLRTLDLNDNTWVTGLEMTWEGALTARQNKALAATQADPYFQGQRAAPFELTEADRLAETLARELACASMRQMQGEYVVLLEADSDGPLQGTTELVGNNLATIAPLQFTDDPTLANAVLRGKAHEVDEGLNQFWATLAPLDATSSLPTLNANAYVQTPLPDKNLVELPRSDDAVLSQAQLIEIDGRNICRNLGDSCMAMQVRSKEDTVVFFLNHQKNHGLVRISSRSCRERPDARVMRANDTLNVPLPIEILLPDAATATSDWKLVPEADTYYALAVANSKAAHVVARHLQKLPQRCTSAMRFGLRDETLEAWLAELAQTIGPWRESVDWQAIQVRNVY